ncbi:MAG: secretin N-terminal domain-containing protein [Candidatus Omnitrophica bacterium]|nr:secretin N-terminal domain-containing protein [Candidatus Omnitrophota bacterium]
MVGTVIKKVERKVHLKKLCVGLGVTAVFFVCLLSFSPAVVNAQDLPASPVSGNTQPATPGPTVNVEEGAALEEGHVTLDFKDADINNVLRILSLKSGMNIVAGPEVSGTVTIRLTDVPWETALNVVLKTYGYVSERDGNIIRVTTKENAEKEPLKSQTFSLNYTTAEEVQEAVKEMLSERGKIKTVNRTNSIIVTDLASNIDKIGKIIGQLDKPTQQCYIDSKIVRTELGRTENMGIDWKIIGGLSSGAIRPTTFPFLADGESFLKDFYPRARQSQLGTEYRAGNTEMLGSGATRLTDAVSPQSWPTADGSTTATTKVWTYGSLDFSSLSAVLQFLKTRTNTKVVSNPRISVLNHQPAEVQVGQDVPIPTFERNETTGSFEVTGFDWRKVGVTLKVTPHINYADQILVDLQPEVSSQGTTITYTATLAAPTFNVTVAKTQLLIEDGETIAIGGLITDQKDTTEDKVPVLGDIPFVGKLFRSKRETSGSSNKKIETIFFVTVTIVDTAGQPVKEMKKLREAALKKAEEDAAEAKKAGIAKAEKPGNEKAETEKLKA